MARMSADPSGKGLQDAEAGTWATETLPLSVRKELLERELTRLGLRKPVARESLPATPGAAGPQQGDGGCERPQADAEP